MARILSIAVSILSTLLLLSGALMVFNRQKRQKHLQNRIVSDLHDEVGSNLASITILAAGPQEQCDSKSPLTQSRLADAHIRLSRAAESNSYAVQLGPLLYLCR